MSGNSAVLRTAAAGGLGLLVTAVLLVVPSFRLAYRSPDGHLVVETAVTLIAGLVALLLYGRYRRRAAVSTLLLVYAMSLLAFAALVLVTVPGLLSDEDDTVGSSWAALVVRLVGALLVLAAAVLPSTLVQRATRPWRDVAVVGLAVVALVAVAYALASGLPDVVRVTVLPEESSRPVLHTHGLVATAQLIGLASNAVAAAAFTRRSAAEGDEMLGWVGAATAMGACASLQYVLFPSLYTDWLYAGDLLRLGMYVLLLVGAVREIRVYWEAQAVAAVEVERRRLARELHDGVVQELGYIRSESLRPSGGEAMARISAASLRALDEARRAITALTAPPDERLADAVRLATEEVGDRFDVPVRLALDESVSVSPEKREQLVRIAREAVSNAARHASAPDITVCLRPGRLEVADRGRGFDVTRGRNGGFGLASMRERAEAIGAAIVVESEPQRGTRVTLTW